jgi:hypothetical protein
MYLVIRHHLANGFRRPCVFSCQMAIDSYQTTIDSHQTTIDSYQTTTMDSYHTNRAVKVHKLLRMQNPPTPCPLPPCQGGRGLG